MKRLPWLAALGLYGALLAASAPRWPDDWDGIGFVESVRDFNLAAFRPHPPGYPVYVALLRVAAALTRDAWAGCVAVAVASGMVASGFAWGSLRRLGGERAAWLGAGLVAFAPVAFRSCSGVGSEGPALACAFACVWGLVEGEGVTVGLGAGLGMGVRLSWGPLYLVLLLLAPARNRRVALATAGMACLVWAVPLVAVVGPVRLASLYATHFAGHAARWGGSVLTEPGLVRFAWLSRDLFVDGMGAGWDPVGVGIGALLAPACVLAMGAWRRVHWRGGKTFALVAVPYALWAFFGQNLRDQPRHLLPLVAMLAFALALGAARLTPRRRAVFAALLVLMAARAGLDAWDRRTIPPPGEQLVELARVQPSPERLAVFGVASVRFFEGSELSGRAFVASGLGDAEMALTRMDRLPARVWITSEVAGLAHSIWPVAHVATLCRPARLDRRAPCIDVYDWRPRYLPVR